MGYTKKYLTFKIPRWPVNAASRLANYTKEILKNTKKNQETRGSNTSFDTYIDVHTWCISENHTCHECHICHI